MLLCRALTKLAGGEFEGERYYNIVHPKKDDGRTAEDIISNMKNKVNGGDK